MFPRRRCVFMTCMLCLTCVLCLAVVLHGDQQAISQNYVQGIPDGAVTSAPLSNLANSEKSELAGRGQQRRRHLLLDTMATPTRTHHTSFIKLEGVDSTGNDMFLAHGASLEQLKVVCAALAECEGFNSEGWIKSRVSGKKRATIDLYLKQVATGVLEGQSSLEDVAAGVFADHMTEYNKMDQNLRIYIYQTDIGQDMPSLEDYKYGVEQLFVSLLAKSKFRTMDPSKATLFFLPSRCTAYRKSVSGLKQGIEKAASTIRDMVTQIRSQFRFWNETLGTDHFYICAHDMGTEVAKLADVELWKNAIGLVNTADYSEQYFIPHKDISLPPHPGRGTIDWALMGQGGATFDPYQRTRLAFMAGNGERGPVRPRLFQYYETDSDFYLVKGHMPESDYIRALKTSKFCLCARGNKAWSPRVMDAVWFGCIPVFLADHYLPPLYDLIPWNSISLSIPEKQVSSLKLILQNVSPHKLAVMQRNILKVYQHLTWHDPPQPYDAFYGVLFQLWRRRHVHRASPYPLHVRTWTVR